MDGCNNKTLSSFFFLHSSLQIFFFFLQLFVEMIYSFLSLNCQPNNLGVPPPREEAAVKSVGHQIFFLLSFFNFFKKKAIEIEMEMEIGGGGGGGESMAIPPNY